jgi:hypothetical protein
MPASRLLFIFVAFMLLAANNPQAEIDTATVPPNVTHSASDRYEKIKLGMARREVYRLLGGLAATDLTEEERYMSIVNGDRDLWRVGGGRIWVFFYGDGSVASKTLELGIKPGAKRR